MTVATTSSRWFAQLLPASASADAHRLVSARSIRGLADGFVSVMLAAYLRETGYSAFQIGAIITGTLLGSALLTLLVGVMGHRVTRRRLLFASAALMLFTGAGFAFARNFWTLLIVGAIGTLNPSGGDVSVFLPTEQSLLSESVAARDRTALFARYNLGGIFAVAVGSLFAGTPLLVAHALGAPLVEVQRYSFLVYAVVAGGLVAIYAGLSVEQHADGAPHMAPLRESRGIVIKLSLLFSMDAFGGGFLGQALLSLWLFERFHLSVATAGEIFFVAGLLSAASQLAASWLSQRIGLINTMVFTHLPSNIFLILAAFMPTAPLAVAMLCCRTLLGQMDVPARQSYVMAVVSPGERAAAASVTNVPRSLASAGAPLIAGALLSVSTFGWPLLLGAVVRIVYDGLLLWQFQSHHPPEESPVR